MKRKVSYRDKLLELANIYDVREIKEYVNRLQEKYLKLNIIITGGDSTFLRNKIKNAIFADQDFLAIGLNNILKYNEGH